MSQIVVSSNASGTGVFTLASPATNTNRTLTLPDGAGTLATDTSTLTQFNASGSAPVYATRAWVNFNGTGTVAIRASGNVSSITDNGVGDYTANFSTAMPDANYTFTVGIGLGSGLIGSNQTTAPAAGSFRFYTTQGTTVFDFATVTLSILR